MKIFLAGATGALGRQLLPRQVERGHEVTGMSRSESKQQLVRDLGGRPVVGDALDPESVAQAVAAAEPEAIVHQLTAIPHALDHRAAGPAHVAAPLGDRERHPHRADRRPPPRRPRRSYEDFQERTSSPLRRREVAGPDVVVIVDFGDGWRVQALAAALRCRRRHLCARFGEEIGVPPNSHARLGQAATARDERRAAAEALLADTTAAELTGFISTADALLGRLAEVIGGAGDPRGAP